MGFKHFKSVVSATAIAAAFMVGLGASSLAEAQTKVTYLLPAPAFLPAFGPWMLAAFRLLAGGKFLRGTAFDPFGRLAERREERELIEDYRTMVEELLGALSAENLSIAIECANLPDQVRGYGPVKTESIGEYRQERAGLLHRFHNPASVVQIQDVA